MGISAELSALKSTAEDQLPLLDSKKRSENALLLPFFAALGYHPFDVREVEPEFTIELGGETEWKVDYAVKKGGDPMMLFQCVKTGTNLDAYDPSPLLRFLKKSQARVGAVTDGIKYRFYADLESFYEVLKGEPPTEKEPFLTFCLLGYTEGEVENLKRLAKPEFRAEEILSFAHHLKYTRLFRAYLQRQRESPDETFVRFMMEQVHGGESPKGDVGMYESAVREALRQLMEEGAGAQDQASSREETQEEKTEGEPRQSNRALDKADGNAHIEGENTTPKDFEEFFRERLGR